MFKEDFFDKIVMQVYGYLFGVLRTIKDTHRDEVFIEKNQQVIMRNSIWLVDYNQLVAIARDLGVNPYELTIIEGE